jgi:hypothetical protein
VSSRTHTVEVKGFGPVTFKALTRGQLTRIRHEDWARRNVPLDRSRARNSGPWT